MSAFLIRPAVAADAAAIASFNRRMAMETENKQLSEVVTLEAVLAVVNDPSKGFYLVAEHAGELCGSLMVTYEWSDWRNINFWWIQSVYVLPQHRGKGVYRALYAKVKELAHEQHIPMIRLYVEKDNVTAQKTYHALGMTESHYVMFEEVVAGWG